MLRRGASREARDRQVEAAPEKVDRAHLAHEIGAKFLEQSISLKQRAEEAMRPVGIVLAEGLVAVEVDGFRDFVGHRVDLDLDAEPP